MQTKKFTLTAFFVALLLLFSFTPIGFIHLGLIKITFVQIPVIIGSILLGPRVGALLGFIFASCSFMINTMSPSLLSFAFSPLVPVIGTSQGSWWALVVCFIPRILVGIFPYYIFRWLSKNHKASKWALGFSGLVGSLTNTFFVMGLIFTLFQQPYSEVIGTTGTLAVLKAILSVVLLNGIPEAVVATIFTITVCSVLLKVMKGNPSATADLNK